MADSSADCINLREVFTRIERVFNHQLNAYISNE